LLNLNEEGCLIQCERELSKGQEIELHIPTADGEIHAVVRRRGEGNKYGLKFQLSASDGRGFAQGAGAS
jgi:hypothetical protein